MAEATSGNDALVMLLAAPLALPVAAPLVFGAWTEGRQWMIERGFIASPEDAVWSVPGWDGAGVGSAHIVLGACLVVLIMVVGSMVARRGPSDESIDT
ncbi:hypothetical protein CLV30_11492 [Haloactinopolyspora alba]|uniref:Uncharacterized protein n=1 Tax=Haloactinopolyspora alba TaxID=648780 RepID=A0A2P8DVW8_9ACTN|nr:hypothetical protein [Haloactinopolyspora alba]PSL01362.1 hypothetical protein CLV30_11492 [Haloactinopolyspora alba]